MEYIKVKRRLPFGFKGEWGNVYKLYTFDVIDNNIIRYQDNNYLKVRGGVQFKYDEQGTDRTKETTQAVGNLLSIGITQYIETTDAYFDNDTKRYKCVADVGDLINVFNDWWVVERVEEKSVYTPNRQTFYRLLVKKINEKMILNEVTNA